MPRLPATSLQFVFRMQIHTLHTVIVGFTQAIAFGFGFARTRGMKHSRRSGVWGAASSRWMWRWVNTGWVEAMVTGTNLRVVLVLVVRPRGQDLEQAQAQLQSQWEWLQAC